MAEQARTRRKLQEDGERKFAPYSSKIIKAGAMLADTKTLLVNWNTAVPAQANLDRLRRENVLGKVSRSRVQDVLAIFRQRFLGEESATKALVVLARMRHVENQLLEGASPGELRLATARQSRFWAEVQPAVQARWALIAAAAEVLLEADRVAKEIKKPPATVPAS